MPPVIQIDNLSKAYRIGLKEEIPDTLVGAVQSVLRAPLKNLRRLSRLNTFAEEGDSDDLIWALKDVSFDVEEGEVVGIIGRNGAGKSTLLKILSRITEPTRGRALIHGRVSSLLEVGTGFHPELSGRENVYMNGTVLGMTKREIDRKFDQIVEFSGVEKFLDTPIKRYSSGMQVRLAFSVAAHLEPEILIVDEVLAVGDAEFQKKCLGKMQDVARGGRTVLFVSHNMHAVENLCERVVVLRGGGVHYIGDTSKGISEYMSSDASHHSGYVSLDPHPARRPGSLPILKAVRFLNADGEQAESFKSGSSVTIEFAVDPVVPLSPAYFGIGVNSMCGKRILSVTTFLSDSPSTSIKAPCLVHCRIPELPLIPGRYLLCLSAGTRTHRLMDALEESVPLEIVGGDYFGNGATQTASLGHVAVRSYWSTEQSCLSRVCEESLRS